jgi:hypothetical protein
MSARGFSDPRAPLGLAAKVRLALEVAASYSRARLAARRGDIRVALQRLRPDPAAGEPDALAVAEAHRLARATDRTLRLIPGDSRCLNRSLVLTHLLARRGLHGTLVIGVRPGSSFAAHAWVELDGVPLLPTGDGEFGRLVEL